MFHRLLADAVLVLHLAFVLFAVLGGLLVLRWRRVAWAHVPAAAWAALVSVAAWTCPLTPLENHFRRLGGQAGYEGGFIEHYIVGLLYPAGLTRGMQLGLAAFVVAINATVYVLYARRTAPRARGKGDAPHHHAMPAATRQPSRGLYSR